MHTELHAILGADDVIINQKRESSNIAQRQFTRPQLPLLEPMGVWLMDWRIAPYMTITQVGHQNVSGLQHAGGVIVLIPIGLWPGH